jgi:hypothetical protein
MEMDQPVKSQDPSDRITFSAAGTASLLSNFVMVVGLASLFVALFGSGRSLLLLLNMDSFTTWDSPNSILFYFPAGAILLLANQVYSKSQMPNWLLGGVIGFTVYVSLHLLADLAAELEILGFLGLPFYMSSQFGEILWHPIDEYLIRRFGSFRYWIQLLGISWFSAIPFVALGMLYASVYKNRWLWLLAVVLLLLLICFCLFELSTEILWDLMG